MAIHTVEDFNLSHPHFTVARMRKLAENVELFNAATAQNGGRGAGIAIRNRNIVGEYETTTQFMLPDNTVHHRDPRADIDLTPSRIQDEDHVGIKVNTTVGPFRDSIDKFLKKGLSPEQQSMVIGEATADYQMRHYATSGFGACIAALNGMNGTPLVHNHTGPLNQEAFIAGLALMGDNSDNIVSLAGNSNGYFKVMADNYAKDKSNIAGLVVTQGANPTLDLPYIRTDNPVFDNAIRDIDGNITTPATEIYTLMLASNGITLTESEGQLRMYSEIQLLKSNVMMILQGEGAFNLDLMGIAYDIGNAGVAPTDAAIRTPASWVAYAPPKQCPGVLIVSQA